MIKLLLFILVYVIGFFISLMLLHKYKKELDVDCYDPPHPSYYDDYSSNATAYLTFSLIWPMFWLIMLFQGIWRLLVKLSKSVGDNIK